MQGDVLFARLRARLAGLGRVRSVLSLAGAGVLGLACVLVVSACGSSSAAPGATTTTSTLPTTSSTGTTPTGTTAGATAFAAYRSCLQSHGDTSGFGGGGPFRRGGGGGFGGTGTTATTTTPAATTPRTRPALSAADQKAIAACASLRPAGGFGRGGAAGGFPGGGFTSTNPAFQKFEACLKAHGVKTSTTPGAPGGFGGGSGANRTAVQACRSDLPAGSFGGGAGFPGGGGASGTTGGGGAPSGTFAAYQSCLRSHGVTLGATNQSQSKLAAAQAACASVLHPASSTTPATTTSG